MPTFANKQNQPQKPVSSSLAPSNTAAPGPHRTDTILHLQRTSGNQAVERLLQTHGKKPDVGTVETLADWLPQTRGTVSGQVTVHPASLVADRDGANAVTLGSAVHLSSGLSQLDAAEQQRVLAHEAVHVAQHSAPGPAASRQELEMEADQLSSQVLLGHAAQPQFHADAMTALADDGGPLPGDKIAVERAKERREVLLRFKERQDILNRRKRLDDSMLKMMQAIEQRSGQKGLTVDDYRQQERTNVALLNKKPLTFEMTATSIRITARFQVRFEGLTDKEAQTNFPVLERNFQQGVRDTWNQKLSSAVLNGRTFELIPVLKLVKKDAPRDRNFWLITVRPTDKGPMAYGKTSLGVSPGGVPMAVTDPTLDDGVMSIPPVVVNDPNVLGHETLHLFGMVDRYAILPPSLTPTGQQENVPLRDTKDRLDPLGDAEGKIFEEDLGFVLDQFGVYPTMTEIEVERELRIEDEIISTGRDPKSLIKKRKDFVPEMVKQAENLD